MTRPVSYFLGLITPYHSVRPKFTATVDLWIRPFVAAAEVASTLPRVFDLDEAIGVQLDKVGEWIGYTRNVVYPLPHAWFSFDDEARGWDKGRWRIPEDPKIGTIVLDDDLYRQLLRAKVKLNQWDGLQASANAIYSTFLNSPATYAFVQDNHDGTQYLGISGEIPPLQYLVMLSLDYLPARPAGVSSTTYVTSVNKAPLFGFDVQNEKIAGWDDGAWGVGPRYIVDYGYTPRRTYDPTFRRSRLKNPPPFGFDFDDFKIGGFDIGIWRAEGQRPGEYGHDGTPILKGTFAPAQRPSKPAAPPTFGFDRQTSTVNGFDRGAWAL